VLKISGFCVLQSKNTNSAPLEGKYSGLSRSEGDERIAHQQVPRGCLSGRSHGIGAPEPDGDVSHVSGIKRAPHARPSAAASDRAVSRSRAV
jgi:hypothetical protein